MRGLSLPVMNRNVLDSSILNTFAACPRKAFYQYVLNRAPLGDNYAIGFGVAYHTFRDKIEIEYQRIARQLGDKVALDRAAECYEIAMEAATAGWNDPPIGHKKDWMTYERLISTLQAGFSHWYQEKQQGLVTVLLTEQPFTLELPSGRQYGGRIDQLFELRGKLWLRDFKTTSYMGSSFPRRFDPNHQISGYTWGSQELSGRPVEGVQIEVVYNTKKIGPEIHTFLSTRSEGHLEAWQASIEREYDDWQRNMEATPELGMYAWPMRTNSCDAYGGCYFRDACQKEYQPQVEAWLEFNTQESVWDFTNPEGEEGVTD
jgi:hypothetical protein